MESIRRDVMRRKNRIGGKKGGLGGGDTRGVKRVAAKSENKIV